MKHVAIALAALVALFTSANASDLKRIYEAPDIGIEEPVTSYPFTGFGLGIDVGGQFNSTQINDPFGPKHPLEFDGISSDGLIGGAHLEYLFAVDRWRFGAYGEGGFSNVDTTFKAGPYEAEVQQDSYYGIGLKAGATIYGSSLLYVRAGYDWSQWSTSESWMGDESHSSETDVGSWLAGVGIDTMVSHDWSLGLGVDYLMVDDVEDAKDLFDDSEMIRAKARLTRRF